MCSCQHRVERIVTDDRSVKNLYQELVSPCQYLSIQNWQRLRAVNENCQKPVKSVYSTSTDSAYSSVTHPMLCLPCPGCPPDVYSCESVCPADQCVTNGRWLLSSWIPQTYLPVIVCPAGRTKQHSSCFPVSSIYQCCPTVLYPCVVAIATRMKTDFTTVCQWSYHSNQYTLSSYLTDFAADLVLILWILWKYSELIVTLGCKINISWAQN